MFDLATQILGLSGTFNLKDATGKIIKDGEIVATATILHPSHPTHEKAWIEFGKSLRELIPEGSETEPALNNDEHKAKVKSIRATYLTAITQSIDGVKFHCEEIGKDKAKIKTLFLESGLDWLGEQFFAARLDNSIFLPTLKKTKKG